MYKKALPEFIKREIFFSDLSKNELATKYNVSMWVITNIKNNKVRYMQWGKGFKDYESERSGTRKNRQDA